MNHATEEHADWWRQLRADHDDVRAHMDNAMLAERELEEAAGSPPLNPQQIDRIVSDVVSADHHEESGSAVLRTPPVTSYYRSRLIAAAAAVFLTLGVVVAGRAVGDALWPNGAFFSDVIEFRDALTIAQGEADTTRRRLSALGTVGRHLRGAIRTITDVLDDEERGSVVAAARSVLIALNERSLSPALTQDSILTLCSVASDQTQAESRRVVAIHDLGKTIAAGLEAVRLLSGAKEPVLAESASLTLRRREEDIARRAR